jgi:curved DNA-binding protein CbpA
MMSLPDYYAVLEVSPDASPAQIKRSYRRLARKYHPDVSGQAQDAHIKQLNEAYAVLKDRVKRAEYDIQRLEEQRMAIILDLLRHEHARRQQTPREPEMTWVEGIAGFVRELKRGLHED